MWSQPPGDFTSLPGVYRALPGGKGVLSEGGRHGAALRTALAKCTATTPPLHCHHPTTTLPPSTRPHQVAPPATHCHAFVAHGHNTTTRTATTLPHAHYGPPRAHRWRVAGALPTHCRCTANTLLMQRTSCPCTHYHLATLACPLRQRVGLACLVGET